MHTNNTHEENTKNECQIFPENEKKSIHSLDGLTEQLTSQELEALREGSHKVYQKLYLQFVKPLIQYITMFTRSEVLAEELAQDILAMVWINRQKINPAKNIKGYLFTIARNTITDYYRKQKVHTNYLSYQTCTEESTHPTDSFLIAKDIERFIKHLVDQMPRQRKKIFELSYRNGWSSGEIAEHLSLSKKAVEKQISYARKVIRERMAIA
jgi:RNA polymerase sigma-70 factor (ECF subfamily)